MSLYFTNDFPDTIYVALVFGLRTPPSYTWWKAGWYKVDNGQTVQVINGPLDPDVSQFIFVNAQTADDSTYWAGPLQVEVTDNAFHQRFSDNTGDTRTVGFREIDTNGFANFTLTFVGNRQWALRQHDARRSGLSAADISGNSGTVAWSAELAGGVAGLAVGEDGTIYAAGVGILNAVDPDGTLRWSLALNDIEGLAWPVAIGADSTLYVGTGDTLLAVSPDGTQRWTIALSLAAAADLAIGPDGTIYAMTQANNVGGTDFAGTLQAIDPDGTLKWSFDYTTNGESATTPAVADDGTVYFGGGYAAYAVNPDGTLRWTAPLSNAACSPAVGSDGTICFPTGAGGIHGSLCTFKPDGSPKWVFAGTSGGNDYQSPAIDADGNIFYSGANNPYTDPSSNPLVTVGLDASGALLWNWDMGGANPVLGADGTICLWTLDDRLGPHFW